jgi:hypothetical protein
MSIKVARIIAKVYPNGEFTLGYDSSKRMLSSDIRSQPECVQNWFYPSLSDEIKGECRAIAAHRVMESTLGSSLVANSPKAKRGLRGISNRAARSVRNMAFILEREYGNKRLSFTTVTLPELSKSDHDNVTRNWASVVKDFFKDVGREYYRKSKKDFEYVAVTEVQEKRFERTGYVGLHIHFVYLGRLTNKGNWILSSGEIRDSWSKAVSKFCSEEYAFNASENCQRVRKSAEGYLGKYLTKGSKTVRRIIDEGYSHNLPSTWYSRSLSLSRRVTRRVRRSAAVGDFLSKRFCRRLTLNTVSFYREITIESPSMGERIIGYVGKFRRTIDIYAAKDIMGLLTTFEVELCTNQC